MEFLLAMAGCMLLLAVIVTIFHYSGHVVIHHTHNSDPATSFDVRFPAAFDQRFPAAQSAPAQLRGLPIDHSGSATVPAALPNPRTLRRVMDFGVAQFATGADDAARAKGASLVFLAALLDLRPARQLIAYNYSRSAVVRSVVPIRDAVRFAVDLLATNATAGESAQPAEEPAVALGSYFARRGELLSFTKHLVDVIADDERLQTDEQIARLFSIFVRVPGTCTGIKRAISQDQVIDANECSDDLRAALLRTARSRGPIGMEAEGRNRGLQALREIDGVGQ